MRRLSSTEGWGLGIGIMFLLFGIFFVIWPQTMVVYHPPGKHNTGTLEKISPAGSRVYGVLGIVFGAGLSAACLYRPKK